MPSQQARERKRIVRGRDAVASGGHETAATREPLMGFELYWQDVPVGLEPLAHAPEHGCFELPEADMVETIRAMERCGMLDGTALPPFVACESFGLSTDPEFYDEDDKRIEYPLDTPEGLYQRAIIAVQRGDTGGRIPVWKLATNDAWLITREEIERSLQEHDSHFTTGAQIPLADEPSTTRPGWWDEWIDFLRAAVNHGGIEVY